MADTKITGLQTPGAFPVVPSTDVLPIVIVADNSMAASGSTRKVTVNQILGAGGTATLASATITGDLTVDTSTLKVDSANNRVGIGTASPAVTLDISDPSAVIRATSSTGTNTSFAAFANTGGAVRVGAENSAGGGLFTGSSAYSAVLGTTGAYSAHIGTNATVRYSIASDGVATWSNVGGGSGTAMTLNSTGLGVGASPNISASGKALTISGAFTRSRLELQNTDGGTGGVTCGTISWFNGSNLIADITGAANSGSATLGSLAFSTGGSTRLTIDSSGNVGIGVAPSAWATSASRKVIQLSTAGSISAQDTGTAPYTFVASNWVSTATGDQYILGSAAPATLYRQFNGTHAWYYAGAATGSLAFTHAMTLDASGNLLVGTTSGTFRGTFVVAGGANRDILAAGVTAVSDGFQVKWDHATTKINVIISNMPTSSAGLAAGTLWNDAGTIKIA